MQCEECQMPLWKAGEVVPAGTYVRGDNRSYRAVTLEREGQLTLVFVARDTEHSNATVLRDLLLRDA